MKKLIERVEKLSYEKGYLEGQLALRTHEYAPTINTTESSVTNSAEPEAESTPQAESVMVEELAIDSITESTTPEGDFAISEYIHGQMAVVTDEEQKHDSQSQHDSAEESTGDETAEPSDNSEKELVTAKASTQSKTAHNSKRKKRRR